MRGIFSTDSANSLRMVPGAAFDGSVAQNVAVFPDRVLAFEHLHHDRTADHRLDEFAKERTLLVHGVKVSARARVICTRFCATMRRPAFSMRALIAPVRLRRVASGLRIEKVRSIAICGRPLRREGLKSGRL